MTFLVAENAADVVNSARAEIATIISDHPTNLAAKFVRMGFHDCVGGCDGCVDMLNGDNFGLDVPIEALQPVVDLYSHTDFGVTRADLWVLAALEGASGSQDTLEPREFAMEWVGRPTCEDLNSVCVDSNGNDNGCSEDRGPHRELPSPDLDTKELLAYFQTEFDYQEAWETVAIMGAHSLGTLSRENTLGAWTMLTMTTSWEEQASSMILKPSWKVPIGSKSMSIMKTLARRTAGNMNEVSTHISLCLMLTLPL
jgi:hypothetical protein